MADKNRKVYADDTNGGPLGSWSAGKLANNAIVEGIATNGTDVWIVDSGTDNVYEYASAGAKTFGSFHFASATFALASGNTNPQGIADPPPSGGGLVVARPPAVASVYAMAPPLDSIRPNTVVVDRWNDDQSKHLPLSDVLAA